MPTDQERRRIERDRADQNILRRAAAWLRHDPNRTDVACLNRSDALALAELLDVLATALPDVDSRVQWQAVESCRLLLGEPMDTLANWLQHSRPTQSPTLRS